jgi:hypothetical protein
MREKLDAISVHTCADIRAVDPGRLRDAVGPKHSATLREYANAVDRRPWEPRPTRKSIGAQSSWGVRFHTAAEAEAFARKLSAEVGSRLARQGMRGTKLTLTLWRAKDGWDEGPRKGSMGHGACDHISRSLTLPDATAEAAAIGREVCKMLKEVAIDAGRLRGMGISISKLRDEGSAADRGSGGGRPLPARIAAAPSASKYVPGKEWWDRIASAARPPNKPATDAPPRQMQVRAAAEAEGAERPSKSMRVAAPAALPVATLDAPPPFVLASPPRASRLEQHAHPQCAVQPLPLDSVCPSFGELYTPAVAQTAVDAMKETLRVAYAATMLPPHGGPVGQSSTDQADETTRLLECMCELLLSPVLHKNGAALLDHSTAIDPAHCLQSIRAILSFARELGASSLTYAATDQEMTAGFELGRIVAWLDACDRLEKDAQSRVLQ